MTLNEEQVEWIVAEVIRRLGLLLEGTREAGAAAAELVMSENVITMRTIEGRLMGVKRVVVPRRAVMTPAVKDELKSRKIELVRT